VDDVHLIRGGVASEFLSSKCRPKVHPCAFLPSSILVRHRICARCKGRRRVYELPLERFFSGFYVK
jgi:hypothetical protein